MIYHLLHQRSTCDAGHDNGCELSQATKEVCSTVER